MHALIGHALQLVAAHPASTSQLTTVQVVVLALLQGVAELFPVSSLGHTVIAPKLLGWQLDQHADSFLPFVVALHLGTGIALIIYFWRDWLAILTPMVRSVQRGALGSNPEERLGWLLAVGTIPAAVIGVFFEKRVRDFFADPKVAAGFLIVNGLILFAGAIVVAVILAILAVLYLAGNGPLDPGRHIKHALLFFVLAAGALAVANFNRPGAAARR